MFSLQRHSCPQTSPLNVFSSAGGTERTKKPAAAAHVAPAFHLKRAPPGVFFRLWGRLPPAVGWVCSEIVPQPCPHRALSCPIARPRGVWRQAGDMLGRRPGEHCTEFCYYSHYCSNHGNAMEDCSGLHCGHGCQRGRRRSQEWVCEVTRWDEQKSKTER